MVVENARADAERDGRNSLVRPNSLARTGTGKKVFFPDQLTTRRISNHIRLVPSVLNVIAIHIHTHIHTCIHISALLQGEGTAAGGAVWVPPALFDGGYDVRLA